MIKGEENASIGLDETVQGGDNNNNVDLSRILDRIDQRLNRLECKNSGYNNIFSDPRGPPKDPPKSADNYSCRPKKAAIPPYAFGPDKVTAEIDELSEVQERFNVIKSSVDKVLLPNHLKLHDNRIGIKREDQPTLKKQCNFLKEIVSSRM